MTFSEREAYPVTIGDFVIYCEEFKAFADTSYTEKPTVSGVTKITDKCRKSTQIVLSGRVYDETSPMRFISYANSMTGGNSLFSVEYRGITFSQCRFKGYTAEDKGEDFIYVSVTLATAGTAVLSGGS